MGTDGETNLATGIGAIIGLSILFFICGLVCYCVCCIVFREEEQEDPAKLDSAISWTAKHYYDPPPSVLSPPPEIFQPSVYSFKLENGTHPHHLPHAVINPAVLQYPSQMLEDRTAYSSHFQPSSSSRPRRFSVSRKQHQGSNNSRGSSKVSPTNIPLVHSDMNEMIHMGNGNVHGHGHADDETQWHP